MMAIQSKKPAAPFSDAFDVVVEQVVGSVSITADGEESPHVLAFQLIAEHSECGTYRFPLDNGETCVVTVSHETVV